MEHGDVDLAAYMESRNKKRSSIKEQHVVSSDESLSDLDTYKKSGLKTFLCVQFEPQFRLIVFVGVYLSTMCSLIDAAVTLGVQGENLPSEYNVTLASKLFR